MEQEISTATFNKILVQLKNIDPVFSEMWRVQKKMILTDDDDVDTAMLIIDGGNFRIKFNDQYWKKLSMKNRIFVICHEYAHVILGHWLNPAVYDEWLNVAQDIQVNEYLIKNFSFVPFSDDMATISIVFREKANKVEKDRDYEYYHGLIKKCLKKSK